MPKQLRVLNVEDSANDEALLKRFLISAGYDLVAQRVDTADEMKAALSTREWDIVLCDYSMPHFNALSALEVLRATGIDIPFIIISGTVGEDVAVEAMLSGAHDYLSKDNLTRLIPAIERELKEAQNRRELREAEIARRISQERYRALFEYAPDGIIISSPDDYYLDANASMCQMLGYTPQELIGMHARDIVIRSQARELDSEFLLVQTTPDYNREWHFRRKDGSEFPAEVIATIMPDGNLLAMIRDISERLQAAEALREIAREKAESLALIGTILSRAPIGFAFHDRDMRYVRINETLAAINGLSVEQHLGRTLLEILPEMASVLDPIMQKVIDTGEPVVDFELSGEAHSEPGKQEDWLVSFYPVRIVGGEVLGIGVLVSVVTSRKKAEHELRESESLLAASQRITHQGSWVMDLSNSDNGNRHEERWSDEHYRIFGFEPGSVEITDEVFYNSVHPDDRKRLAEAMRRAMDQEESFDIEHRIILPNGSERTVQAKAEVVLDSDTGKPLKLLGSVQDITDRKHSEEAMRKSEERYRDLVENAIDIIYTLDVNGNYTSVNKACEQITGYHRSESLSRSMFDSLAPEYRKTGRKVLAAHLAGKKMPAYELELIAKDGHRIVIEVNTRPIIENGVAIGVQGIARDITQRKLAQESLRVSEEHFRFLNDLAEATRTLADPEQMMALTTRMLGEHLRASRCAYADVESDSEQFTILHDYVDGCASTVGSYHLSLFGSRAVATLNSGQTLIIRNVEAELLPDEGADMFNAIGIKAIITCPLVKDGNLRAMMAVHQTTARDWTPGEVSIVQEVVERCWATIERRSAEDALRESDEKFRQLADNITDAFWIRSPDMSKIYYISPAYEQIWGRTLESDYADPQEWYDLIVPEDRDLVRATYAALMADSPNVEVEYRIVRPDDTIRWVRARGFQVLNDEGEIIRLAGIITDLTERKELEEQFRQSHKMEAVGILAGGIAHDFNNLLTAINGYSDLTLRKLSLNDPLRRNIEEVRNAGSRAAELTGQLLAFSRKQVLKPVVINLNTVVSNIEKMLRRIIRESIGLRVVLDPDLRNIKADPGQMEQVIMNLAINARDAMPDGGTLTIETRNVVLDKDYVSHHINVSPGEFIKMTMTDTGSGIDEKTRPHIFEPFFTTKEVGKGTGLGLSTVYGIVKQSGGDVIVYSEIGHGTTFKIYLPCVDEVVQKPTWVGHGKNKVVGSETILLVEDEEIVRNLVREVLIGDGYVVLTAESGAAALSICETYTEPIHMLLTDVVMPKMGGSELKDTVVKLMPDIKVLLMSGYTDDAVAQKGIVDSETAFIEKPFTPDGLLLKVREVLEA